MMVPDFAFIGNDKVNKERKRGHALAKRATRPKRQKVGLIIPSKRYPR